MTEESIDESFPPQHRYQQDSKVHRKVRRDCHPDYILKHIVCEDKFSGDSQTQVPDSKLFSFVEKNDPFNIGAFDVRFSLNKKGRWEIAKELISKINAYQDDLLDMRVSYLKTVLRDCGWTFKDDKWQENDKAFDTEFVSVKDGELLHKCAKRANKYDLMRTPKPPKKSRKGLAVRGEFSESDGNQNSKDKKIHVLYETATTAFDNRIRDKRDKKIEQAKRRHRIARSKTGKQSSCGRKFRSAEMMELFDDGIDSDFEEDFTAVATVGGEDGDDSDHRAECSRRHFKLSAADFLQPWSKISSRKVRLAKSNFDENYMHWLHSPSYMGFPDGRKSFEDLGTRMAKTSWDKTMLSWAEEMLPFVDIPLPVNCTLEEYISQHAKNPRKVAGIFPETYICDSTTEQEVADLIGQQNAFFSVRMVSCRKGNIVRWVINVRPEVAVNRFNLPKKSRLNASHLCPAEAFLPTECLEEDLLKQSPVMELLSTQKEEQLIQRNLSNTVCGVCLSEGVDGFALQCNHFFCKTCWTIHAREAILNGNVPIYCMSSGCSDFLTVEHAITFLRVSQCEKYRELLWRRISTHDRILRCGKCDTIMHILPEKIPSGDRLAVCQCQYVWCVGCRRRAHHPVPCDFAAMYYDFLRKIGVQDDGVKFPMVYAKNCPSCGYGYSRDGGCTHMTCPVCKAYFCYGCGQILPPFSGHFCTKNSPKRALLIDIVPDTDSRMKVVFEKWVWFRRKQRTYGFMGNFGGKLAATGLEFNRSYNAYIAAVEVLELCEAYLRFTTRRLRNGDFEDIKKDNRRERISRCFKILAFAVERFRDSVDLKEKETIQKWRNKMEECMSEMMQIGYRALPGAA